MAEVSPAGVAARAPGPGFAAGLRERALAWRDRLLASPRFRHWAASFPLTRPIARRRTRALFDLCGGFVYAQVLAACVELRLFELLAAGPRTPSELAGPLALTVERVRRLLDAAESLELVERRGSDRFGLGPLGAAMVDNPGVAAMVRHHAMLYRDLADPVALLRAAEPDTELRRFWAYARTPDPAALGAPDVGAYSELMAASQALVAQEILDAYPVHRHRRLMDVGGGEGAFLCAAAARAPSVELVLVDLPAVAERARARLADAGLAARATAVGADFLVDPLPRGADLVTLVRVVHDHDDDSVLRLLRAAHAALAPGGALLLAEPMAGTPGALPSGAAYFGFYLLAMGSGRPRTPARLQELLHAAGFTGASLLATHQPLLTRAMLAQRP